MSSSNLNQPLLGVYELGRETIGVLSDTLCELESHVVPVIPFGVLRIDTRYVYVYVCIYGEGFGLV